MRTIIILTLIALAFSSTFDIRSTSSCADFSRGFCTRWQQNGTVVEQMAACFPANALMMTQNGLKPMSQIKKGDMVLTSKDGKDVWTRVTAWFHKDPIQAEFLRLKTEKGELVVSGKHNIMNNLGEFQFAQEATHIDTLGEIISVQKIMALGLYSPNTDTKTYYVYVSEGERVLAHAFAHMRNPEMYEGAVDMIEGVWEALYGQAQGDIHPSHVWMRQTFSFLVE